MYFILIKLLDVIMHQKKGLTVYQDEKKTISF